MTDYFNAHQEASRKAMENKPDKFCQIGALNPFGFLGKSPPLAPTAPDTSTEAVEKHILSRRMDCPCNEQKCVANRGTAKLLRALTAERDSLKIEVAAFRRLSTELAECRRLAAEKDDLRAALEKWRQI